MQRSVPNQRLSPLLLQNILNHKMWKIHQKRKVQEAEARLGKSLACHARTIWTVLAGIPLLKKWRFPECLFCKCAEGCTLGDKCSFEHRWCEEQPRKRSKRSGGRSAVAFLKETKNLGCVFQDVVPPRSSAILRKSSNTTKPIRCVIFSAVVLRNANLRHQNQLLNKICHGDSHQRSPNAPKFKDRSQEETDWQEHWAREAAWKLAKKILKSKEKHKATFFSPSEKVVPPFTIQNFTGGKGVCGRLQEVDAHDKQKGP